MVFRVLLKDEYSHRDHMWSTKPKIFTLWSFREKVCFPCSSEIPLSNQICWHYTPALVGSSCPSLCDLLRQTVLKVPLRTIYLFLHFQDYLLNFCLLPCLIFTKISVKCLCNCWVYKTNDLES